MQYTHIQLEEPLDNCTVPRLKNLFKRYVGVESGWTSNDMSHIRRRRVTNDGDCPVISLLRGGRWLLISHRSEAGSIIAFDLNAPLCPGLRLIQPNTALDKQPVTEMKLSVPYTSDSLSIVLCLVFGTNGEDCLVYSHWLQLMCLLSVWP
jgi:hypothetical protein